MKTRRRANKTDDGDQKLPAKKIKKTSSSTGKKRRTPLIKPNATTFTTQCAIGNTDFSIPNVSEKRSDLLPKGAVFKPIQTKDVQHVKDVVEELKVPCVEGKDLSSDDDDLFLDAAENHLGDGKLIQDVLKIAGITEREVSFPYQKPAIQTAPPPGKEDESIGSVLQQKMPAMQTAPPSSKEDELDEFVQRIGSLLPQLLSQNPVSFVKITQTCFHEFMKKVSESKPNLLLHLYQATMVCIDFYQVTMV